MQFLVQFAYRCLYNSYKISIRFTNNLYVIRIQYAIPFTIYVQFICDSHTIRIQFIYNSYTIRMQYTIHM